MKALTALRTQQQQQQQLLQQQQQQQQQQVHQHPQYAHQYFPQYSQQQPRTAGHNSMDFQHNIQGLTNDNSQFMNHSQQQAKTMYDPTYDYRPPVPPLDQINRRMPGSVNEHYVVDQDNHFGNLALPTGLIDHRRREEVPNVPKSLGKVPMAGLTVRELKELTRLRLQQTQKKDNISSFESGGETSIESDIQSISTNIMSRSGTSTPDTDSLLDEDLIGFPYPDLRAHGHAPMSKSTQVPRGLRSNQIAGGLSVPDIYDDSNPFKSSSLFNKSNVPIDYSSFDRDMSYISGDLGKNYDIPFDGFNDMSLKQPSIISAPQKLPHSNILRKQAISNFSNNLREGSLGLDDLSLSGIFGGSNSLSSHFPSPLIAPPFRARTNSQSSVDSPPGSPKTLRNKLPLNLSCPEVVRKRTSSDGSLAFDVAEKMAEAVLNATNSPIASAMKFARDRTESLDSNLSETSFLGKNMRCLSDENVTSDFPGSFK